MIPDREFKEQVAGWFLSKTFDEPSKNIFSLNEYKLEPQIKENIWEDTTMILDNEEYPEIIGIVSVFEEKEELKNNINGFIKNVIRNINDGHRNRIAYL